MKKNLVGIGFGVLLGMALATGLKVAHALTANPASNNLGDSNNTAQTFVYRDTNSAYQQATPSSTTAAGVVYATGTIISLVDSNGKLWLVAVSSGGGAPGNLVVSSAPASQARQN